MRRAQKLVLLVAATALLAIATSAVAQQSCTTSEEMNPGTRSGIEQAARQISDYTARADAASLRQKAATSLASTFSSVEAAVADNRDNLAGARATLRNVYLLEEAGSGVVARAEFFCGIFGTAGHTANSAGFVITNLSPGRYAVVIEDIQGGKVPYTLSLILQQEAADWKLAGFYLKAKEIAGHDGDWFLTQARAYKAKGELHDAWFYYLTAWDLIAPLDFMSTQQLDKLADEMQQAWPKDLPGATALDLPANGRIFRITKMFPVADHGQLYLVVKYEASDISNTAQTFQDNMALLKALMASYPEYREAFPWVVARATLPSGQDYGTTLPTKDIK